MTDGRLELAVLRSFASQLSIALENARLYSSMEGLFRSYLSPDVATSPQMTPRSVTVATVHTSRA